MVVTVVAGSVEVPELSGLISVDGVIAAIVEG